MQRKRKWPRRDSNPNLDHILRGKPAPRPLGHAAAEGTNHVKFKSLFNVKYGHQRKLMQLH